ncbi:hypothetical protein SY83_19230 [Paenibacillus swuensis]|uniref:Small integral membrane protein n=1 Tax=Paenibacillus swuensis TaxID=1178515 RepID=A0A172TM10_9BACL|nr:DUF2273 domain-containing protein [Paenibacillus swuensis]ANE48068.1 hypothetical protein SY83_19230 [Paenibacillus swuensis]
MWNRLWETHSGKLSGVAAGVFFGFIYLFFGFWHMLVFTAIVGLGFYIGHKVDRGETPIPYERIYERLFDRKRKLK